MTRTAIQIYGLEPASTALGHQSERISSITTTAMARSPASARAAWRFRLRVSWRRGRTTIMTAFRISSWRIIPASTRSTTISTARASLMSPRARVWPRRCSHGVVLGVTMTTTGFRSLRHQLGKPERAVSQQRRWHFTSVDAGSPIQDGFDDAWAGGRTRNDGFGSFHFKRIWWARSERLYRNDGNGNQWLKVKLVGMASNRSGIGAKVRVSAVLNRNLNPNPTWQMREISGNSSSSGWQGLVAHFGVGQATNIDTVRIEWPSGIVQEMTTVAPKQLLIVTEPSLPQVGLTNGN